MVPATRLDSLFSIFRVLGHGMSFENIYNFRIMGKGLPSL